MSGKPTGVLLLAILQLINALLWIVAGYWLISTLGLVGSLLAIPFLIVGIIGLILFYGLYTTKGWAWLWTMIINILGIVGGVLAFDSLLTFPYAQLGGFILSIIVVIYLLMPSTRAYFK
ncbi:MAG: hypothetical protein ACFFCX_06910 [Candidatus Sifarchaeia archaeon]